MERSSLERQPPTIARSDPPWQYHTPTMGTGTLGHGQRNDWQASRPLGTYETVHNSLSKQRQNHQYTASEAPHDETDFGNPRRRLNGTFTPRHHVDVDRFSESVVLPYSNHPFQVSPRAQSTPRHCTAHIELPSLHEILNAGTTTPISMMPDYTPPDDDLEDLKCLDAALTEKEVSLPVQQRLQALEATTELAEIHDSANRTVVSRYLRDHDEKVYMAHVSDTDSWETVRDDPIFAQIDPSGPVIQFWHLHLRNQKLALENNGWNDFGIGLEPDHHHPDMDDQMSLAMSESEGGSPPPRRQLMDFGHGYPKENGQLAPLYIYEPPTQPTASLSNTLLPTYPDHIRTDRLASFGRRLPISHFTFAVPPPPSSDQYHVRKTEPAIFEANGTPMRAISGEAISLLQNTNQDQTQTVALPSTTGSSIPPVPDPNHGSKLQSRSIPNNAQRQKSISKLSHAHKSPPTQTSQSSTPTTGPGIKIKLKLLVPEAEPEPEPDSERKSKRTKRATDARATKTQDASPQKKDQQQISSNTETDITGLIPSQPSPPASSSSATTAQDAEQPSTTTIHASASGRSLRQNPTPSRKRRYSEDEQQPPRGAPLLRSGSGRSHSRGQRGRGRPRKRGS